MNQEQILEEFLRSFKISLTSAALYAKGHPSFAKAAEELKSRIDLALAVASPLPISVGPEVLVIAGKEFRKKGFSDELARLLHQRKIRSLHITGGVTSVEVAAFLSALSLPPKDIFASGGIQALLVREQVTHIGVEELDYSFLLSATGTQDLKDAWEYLLQDAAATKDAQKMQGLADSFGTVVGKLKGEELLQDQQLQQKIDLFLAQLKSTEKERFTQCVKHITRAALKNKELVDDHQLQRIKSLLKDLGAKDLGDLLWDSLLTDDGFDSLSFRLFSQLTGEEKSQDISSLLRARTNRRDSLKNDPKAMARIQSLLSAPESNAISEVYRNTLSLLSREAADQARMCFDRAMLTRNYRYILLDLWGAEDDRERLTLLSDRILEALGGVLQDGDQEYYSCLSEAVRKKQEELPDAIGGEQLRKSMAGHLEEFLWAEEVPAEWLPFLEELPGLRHPADYYIDKMSRAPSVSPLFLKAFLRCFPSELPLLYAYLGRLSLDSLLNFIESLGCVKLPVSVTVLQHIFEVSNEFVKIKVLTAMEALPAAESEFFYTLLMQKNAAIKRQALAVLARDVIARKRAVDILFAVNNHWGHKNGLLIEHMALAEMLDLRESTGYLQQFSKKPFFWNRALRMKAQAILEQWNAATD